MYEKLNQLKEQRKLMEGNVEVCAVLDQQIAELETRLSSETEKVTQKVKELEEILKQKIAIHKAEQKRAKEAYAAAKANLEKFANQLKQKLELSLSEIEAIEKEIDSIKGTVHQDDNAQHEKGFNDILNEMLNDTLQQSKKTKQKRSNVEDTYEPIVVNFQEFMDYLNSFGAVHPSNKKRPFNTPPYSREQTFGRNARMNKGKSNIHEISDPNDISDILSVIFGQK